MESKRLYIVLWHGIPCGAFDTKELAEGELARAGYEFNVFHQMWVKDRRVDMGLNILECRLNILDV